MRPSLAHLRKGRHRLREIEVAPNGGTPVTLASGEPTPYALALDDTNVYFTTYVANGSVMKLTEGCTCP